MSEDGKLNGKDPEAEVTKDIAEGLSGEQKVPVHRGLVQQLQALLKMAEAGKLQAMLMVGVLDNGFTIEVPIVANVHQALLMLGAVGVMRFKVEADIATSQARPQPSIVRATEVPPAPPGLFR